MLIRPKYFQLDRRHPLHRGSQLRLLGWQAGSIYARDGDGKPGYRKRHGTLTNMVPADDWKPSPTVGCQVLDFLGSSDQYVNLGNPTGLQITGTAITVACFYRLGITLGNLGAGMLVTKDKNTGGRAYTLDLTRNDANVPASGARFYINGGGTGAAGGLDIACEGRAPVVGDERVVIGTYNGVTVRLYVDGVEKTPSGSVTAAIPAATANVLIGRREYAGYEMPFTGLIGNVCIWNRVLTAAERQIVFSRDPMLGGWIYDPTRRVIPWVSGGAPPAGSPWLWGLRSGRVIGGGVL